MKLLVLSATLMALVTVSASVSHGQEPMKGVMREGNAVIFTGVIIEATKNFVLVDAGVSAYKFPVQEQTKIIDGKGRRISPGQFRKGQGVTVKVVDGGKVMEIRSGALEMELEPIESVADLPGMVTIGEGKDALTAWAAEHTIKIRGKAPGPGWEKVQIGTGESRVRELLGEPGRKQEVGESVIWWYRYASGERRCVAFKEGKVLGWKKVPLGG